MGENKWGSGTPGAELGNAPHLLDQLAAGVHGLGPLEVVARHRQASTVGALRTHWRPLAAIGGHWRPLAAIGGHWRLLAPLAPGRRVGRDGENGAPKDGHCGVEH